MFLGQNKKGVEAAGFSVIIAIAILLLSAGVIYSAIRYIASKADEELQVKLCRVLNEIKFGLREKTSGVLTSGEPICLTIDKHSEEKSFAPSSKYKQDKEGAELEIREMIKNCWYMWLDGSKGNMFSQYSFSEGCFTCYTFKIKEKAKGVTFNSLSTSMEESFYVIDASDKCATTGGGYLRNECNPNEEVINSRKAQSLNKKCCIKGVRNECENKGGICSQSKPSEEYGLYNKWVCPKREQSCYVKKDNIYSYTNYIRKFGPRGGDIYFIPPEGKPASDISYTTGEIYTISFVSPSKRICTKGADAGAGCYAAIGGYALAAAGAVAGGGIVLVKVTTVGGIAKLLSLIGIKGGLIGAGAYQLGIIDNLIKGVADLAVYPISIDVPNFIIVSTLNDAKELGCAIDYGA